MNIQSACAATGGAIKRNKASTALAAGGSLSLAAALLYFPTKDAFTIEHERCCEAHSFVMTEFTHVDKSLDEVNRQLGEVRRLLMRSPKDTTGAGTNGLTAGNTP